MLARRFAAFFMATAIAAAAAGTVHGYFPDQATLGARLLWPAALIAVGAAALAAATIAARLALRPGRARRAVAAAGLVFGLYVAAVLAGARSFSLAVALYVPSAVVLLAAFAVHHARTRARDALLGAAAVVGTLVAAVIQQAGVAPSGLGHDTLYHLVQGAALVPLFVAGRGLATGGGARARDAA